MVKKKLRINTGLGIPAVEPSLSPPPRLRSPRDDSFPSRPTSPKSTASTASPRSWEKAHNMRGEPRSSPRSRPIMGTGKFQGAILGYHSPRNSPTFTGDVRLPTFKGKTESFTRPKSPRARLPTSPKAIGSQRSPRRDLAEIQTSNLSALPSLNRAGNGSDTTMRADDTTNTGANTENLSFGEIMAAMSKTKEDSVNRKRTLRQWPERTLHPRFGSNVICDHE